MASNRLYHKTKRKIPSSARGRTKRPNKKQMLLIIGVVLSLLFVWYAFSVQIHDVRLKQSGDGKALLDFTVSNLIPTGRKLTYNIMCVEPKSGEGLAKASGVIETGFFGEAHIRTQPKNIHPIVKLEETALPYIRISIKENGIVIASWEGSVHMQ